MKTIFAILLMCFTGFAFAGGHLESEEGHHAEAEAESGDHSAHGADAEEADDGLEEGDEGELEVMGAEESEGDEGEEQPE